MEEKKEGKKILKNKWFSVWMDLSETISSVYTPAVGTRRAWASWPAGSGGDGALRVTSVHKWLPIRKGGRRREREGERARMGGWGEEEAQYLVLLKLWEDVGDTWRHQLTVIRISEQFAVAGEERRRGVGSGGRGGAPSLSVSVRTSWAPIVIVSAFVQNVIELLKQIMCLVLMLFKHMQP